MAKTVRKGLIGQEDLNTGVGTFTRQTSTGATQTLTKVNLSAAGQMSITNVSYTPYSAVKTDGFIRVDASSAAITVNLPASATSSGFSLIIKKIDGSANTVTIDANGSELIDGSLTYVLSLSNEFIQITCNGTGWDITSQS